MKKVIVVGSGAGGATVAKELQGSFEVTVLEAGKNFHPFPIELPTLEMIKRTRLLLDEREIQLFFPTMRIHKMADQMILVNGAGLGGTTTLSTGNAIRLDQDLKALGINLDLEFEEIYREIPITTVHQKRWHKPTRQLYQICQDMGLNPQPTPKFGEYSECIACGRCILGCPYEVKWDSRRFLEEAVDNGARIETQCKVEEVVIQKGEVVGVRAKHGVFSRFYPADLVILAAGGLETPVILQNSGIPCEPHLFVDPVLCVATNQEKISQCKEIPMPFIVQRENYILSPYFDYLSFLFNKNWNFPAQNILGIMIKLADCNTGTVSSRGVEKTLTDLDKTRLEEGVTICKEILRRYGVEEDQIFLGTVNAGHPGGMLPLTEKEAGSLHNERLPENLFIADATLIPKSLGGPPILTIIALAKRVSKIVKATLAQTNQKEVLTL